MATALRGAHPRRELPRTWGTDCARFRPGAALGLDDQRPGRADQPARRRRHRSRALPQRKAGHVGGVNAGGKSVSTAIDDEVLLAHAYLNRVAEPGSIPLWAWVRRHGPVAA